MDNNNTTDITNNVYIEYTIRKDVENSDQSCRDFLKKYPNCIMEKHINNPNKKIIAELVEQDEKFTITELSSGREYCSSEHYGLTREEAVGKCVDVIGYAKEITKANLLITVNTCPTSFEDLKHVDFRLLELSPPHPVYGYVINETLIHKVSIISSTMTMCDDSTNNKDSSGKINIGLIGLLALPTTKIISTIDAYQFNSSD